MSDDEPQGPPRSEAAAESEAIPQPGQPAFDLILGAGEGLLGPRHPAIVQAIQRQAEGSLLPEPAELSPLAASLRERLADCLFPGLFFFQTDRSAAVEYALRLARLRDAGQRYKVLSFVGGYHGLTLGALTASGLPAWQAGLGPLVAGARYCPWEDLQAVREAIDEQTTAILLQPILTRQGLRAATPEFLSGLRQLADAHGLWVIADESDIGWGATGDWSASQAGGAAPDCAIMGAGLAGGLPLAAVGLRATAAERLPTDWQTHPALQPPPLSPLPLAAALAVLDTIEHEGLLANARCCGEQWERFLMTLPEDFDFVEAIRCQGTLSGIELDLPVRQVQSALSRRGILVDAVGETTLRVQLPLTLEEATLQQLAEAFHQAFEAVEREPGDA